MQGPGTSNPSNTRTRSACGRARQLLATGIVLGLCLVAGHPAVNAQPINPLWQGHWQVAQSSLAHREGSLQIIRTKDATEVRLDGRVCTLAYDGQINATRIMQLIQERQDVQLDLQNWTGLANAEMAKAQLVGLRREFEQAQQIVAMIPGGNFRRVRLKGAACTSEDDVFFVLNGAGRSNQHLYRINLPHNSVGVEVTLHTLVP